MGEINLFHFLKQLKCPHCTDKYYFSNPIRIQYNSSVDSQEYLHFVSFKCQDNTATMEIMANLYKLKDSFTPNTEYYNIIVGDNVEYLDGDKNKINKNAISCYKDIFVPHVLREFEMQSNCRHQIRFNFRNCEINLTKDLLSSTFKYKSFGYSYFHTMDKHIFHSEDKMNYMEYDQRHYFFKIISKTDLKIDSPYEVYKIHDLFDRVILYL